MTDFSHYLDEKGAPEGLKSVLADFLDAGVRIADLLKTEIKGETGVTNVTGDVQKKVDIAANDLLVEAMKKNLYAGSIISEETENEEKGGYNEGGEVYSVAFDPIDGSSIADVNQAVGSIIGIYTGKSVIGASGRNLVASLYILYGPRLTVMISVGGGTDEFLYFYDKKTYLLNTPNIKLKDEYKMFAPGNLRACKSEGWYLKMLEHWAVNEYKLRYSGGMVSDINHILRKNGGVFSYPAYDKYPDGKLRIVYECNPMAYLIEQAGGSALCAQNLRILDVKIFDLHQRIPFFGGSKSEVAKVIDFMNA